MKVYIETYGCSSNQNDSGIIAALLEEKGHVIVEKETSADLVVINTCSVKHTTENKIISRIKKIGKKRTVITGCMAEAQTQMLRKIAPQAGILGTNNISQIANVVEDVANGKTPVVTGKNKTDKTVFRKKLHNSCIDILEIESGCDFACTFCSTKLAKGHAFSYSQANIISEMKRMRNAGVREFWITGQDVAGYKYGETNLALLLKNIEKEIRGGYFIRIGMQHPLSAKNILNELIDAYSNDHIFKFLHLPVQSGSNDVLENMNRRHSAADFVNIVNAFRKEFPETTTWTDVIVGFPGETENDFELTLDVLKNAKPDFTNVSAYGLRPNTRAAEMKQLSTEKKKERTRVVSELCRTLALDANKKWIGWEGTVLVDEYNKEKRNWIGRNFAYKPVKILSRKCDYNEFLRVKITDAATTHLSGEVIE